MLPNILISLITLRTNNGSRVLNSSLSEIKIGTKMLTNHTSRNEFVSDLISVTSDKSVKSSSEKSLFGVLPMLISSLQVCLGKVIW